VLGEVLALSMVQPRGAVTTVGIVGAESLRRIGLRAVAENHEGVELVGEAEDARGMIELAQRRRPAVLIVDMIDSPQELLSAIAALRERVPETRVLVLASNPRDGFIFQVLSAGVAGVLMRDDPAELMDAVRTVAAGEPVISPEVTWQLLNWIRGADVEAACKARRLIDGLAAREREVLASLAKGMSNGQIARKLYMSEGTVKLYISRLLTRLRCTNRVQAAVMYHHARLPH
jgi:DNA-binding NarL/FixJ family response regulator